MYKYTIDSGDTIQAKNKLHGSVSISGSKNASLPLMVASILTDECVVLNNIPNLLDVQVLIRILSKLGKDITYKNEKMVIKSNGSLCSEAPYKLVKKMRGSIIVLGPLLAKRKCCKVSYPGGCAFGPRPIDLHIKGIEALGANVSIESGYINAEASSLVGATINLTGEFGPTVLGTDNIMMAATLASGKTIIEGAAFEPECTDLANMLVLMGAKIKGIGTNRLEIDGVDKLDGLEYTVIPDRIEAGTYLAMAASSRSKITLNSVCPLHLEKVISLLKYMGCVVETSENSIVIDASQNELKPFNVETLPYPEFPTDLQSIFTALATTIKGESQIKESVFPDRFTHISELNRMGSDIKLHETTIIIHGGKSMTGADVQASDLRAGAALLVAAVAAKGVSNVHRIYHIERGYESMETKMSTIGVNIVKKEDDIL